MNEPIDRDVRRFLWAYWLAVAALFGVAILIALFLMCRWDLGPSFG